MTRVAVALWLLIIIGAHAPTAAANGYYPTRTDDPVPNGCATADCSLREAILDADANPGFDFVQLKAAQYVLTQPGLPDTPSVGDLDVTQPGTLFVLGTRSSETSIDARGTDRIFDIAAGADLIVYSLTVRNGDARTGFAGHSHGGGIHNHGHLGLFWSALTSNTARSTPGITWGGGGLTNAGGAVAELSDDTIARNSTTGCGGGIENGGDLLLQNVTLSGNTSREGAGRVLSNGGAATHGCFFAGGTVKVKNTILASATGSNCAGTITSLGNNLSTDASCAPSPALHDLVRPTAGLLPQFDSDGYVWLYALRATSPAIDAGSGPSTVGTVGCTQLDQVFTRRPQDGNSDGVATCDIGAVERGRVRILHRPPLHAGM
jgi:hypothetical protein